MDDARVEFSSRLNNNLIGSYEDTHWSFYRRVKRVYADDPMMMGQAIVKSKGNEIKILFNQILLYC